MKNNKLFVPECPIKISKEPHVIEIEDDDNALPYSRLTYNTSIAPFSQLTYNSALKFPGIPENPFPGVFYTQSRESREFPVKMILLKYSSILLNSGDVFEGEFIYQDTVIILQELGMEQGQDFVGLGPVGLAKCG